MTVKNPTFNAGLIFWKTLFTYVVSGAFFFGLGWCLHSTNLGIGLALWTQVLGPILLPFAFWMYLRLGPPKLKRLDLQKEPELLGEYLKNILKRPGPRPRVWVRTSRSKDFFWFERLSLGRKSSQELIVTTAWLENASSTQKTEEWNKIWKSISRMSRPLRFLRTVQVSLWIAAWSPLAIALKAMDSLAKPFKLTRGVSLGFFVQRSAWIIKDFCFERRSKEHVHFLGPSSQKSYPHPQIWNSLLWGVWFQIPARALHPLWKEMTHRNAFLHRGP